MSAIEINEIQQMVPPSAYLDSGQNIEEQTRAILSLLFERELQGASHPTLHLNPLTCPNCDTKVTSSRSPYCSSDCREVSSFVRQFRHSLVENTIIVPEKQQALGQKLWFVLGGGYPCRDALVPDRIRLKVIEREGHKCQECGAKATTIDHSGSG